MTDAQKIAELLYPNITKTVEDYLKQYPPRNLNANAEVTRLAPSPTGYIHIGQLFQVIANRAVSQKNNGIFYFRLEDTDSKREVAGAASAMPEVVQHFMPIDEGFYGFHKPEKGEYGPYVQSKRKEIYQAFAKELIAKGLAYPCFCDETSEAMRDEEQKRLKVPTGYYGQWAKCRNLTYEQVKANIDAGKPYTIRIKANGDGHERMIHSDLLRGKISFPKNYVDYILVKSDGLALYHLAHVVDDTLMHTTVVCRGEEWLSSVPLHYQMFEYFGLPVPKYMHTALLLTKDEQTGNVRKISKRLDPWANVQYFIEKGYPSEAVVEYLLNIANSKFEPWRRANPTLPYTEYPFDPSNMSKSGAMFDIKKLDDVSKNIISRMNSEEMYERVLAWAQTYDTPFARLLEEKEDYAKQVFAMDRDGKPRPRKDITMWSEVKANCAYMFDLLYYVKDRHLDFEENIPLKDTKAVLEEYLFEYDHNMDKQAWFDNMKKVARANGFAGEMKEYKENPSAFKGHITNVSTMVRVALTGSRQTPDLYEIQQVLGDARVRARLVETIRVLKLFIDKGKN